MPPTLEHVRMPYLHRFTRVTISGTAFGGAEEWSTGFNVGEVDADATMPTQAQAEAYRDAWATFFTDANAYINSNYSSSLVKVSSVGMDGKSNAADTQFADFPSNTNGVYGGQNAPQVALVATLSSETPRGVASKGRMYLPGIGLVVGADGHLPGAQRDLLHGKFLTFLQEVNAFAGTPNFIMLASPGSLNPDGTPKIGGSTAKNAIVTSLRLGNVYDTQRRRRNGLVEQYKTGTL